MTIQIQFLNTRPDENQLNTMKRLGVSIVSDAQDRYGCLHSTIKPLADSMSLIGPALTVQTYRADNLMIHLAVEMANPGDVLVIDACGFTETGLWGDLMTQMAMIKGIAGVIINGAVRDKMEIVQSGFPVFAKSVCPMGGAKTTLGAINTRISCGGVSVNPGDMVMGDANGVVVVPLENCDAVLSRALELKAYENKIMEQMAAGKSLFDLLGLDKAFQSTGNIDLEDRCGDYERLAALLNHKDNINLN